MLIKSYVDVHKKVLFLFYLLVSRKSSIKIKESLLVKSHTDLMVNPKCPLKYVMQRNFSFDSNPEITRGFLCLPSKNESLQEEQTQSNNYNLNLHVWLSSLPWVIFRKHILRDIQDVSSLGKARRMSCHDSTWRKQ